MPRDLPDRDFSKSVSFMACVVGRANAEFTIERSILAGMCPFRACVIDLTRFGHIRRTPETQRELLELLRDEDYSEPLHLGVTKGWHDGMLVAIRSGHHARAED